jgi:methyl-accepting chemotaxis protein
VSRTLLKLFEEIEMLTINCSTLLWPKVNATESSASQPKQEEHSERNEYFTRLEPQFNRLRAECDHLLQLNQRAMLAKSEAAAGVAQLWFYRTLLGAGVLVVTGLLLALFLSNRIVEPLRQLTATTAKMAGGDLDARVAVSSRDEVGCPGGRVQPHGGAHSTVTEVGSGKTSSSSTNNGGRD